MKNQYVADVNDYCKYGLLRALTDHGSIEVAVAWMLTEDDASRDGGKLAYLTEPHRWRAHDPELFDFLASHIASGAARNVEEIASSGVLPRARFHADVVPRDPVHRKVHFQRTLAVAAGAPLIFFDPDNGLEIPSCGPGRKDSVKYLLWSELRSAYQAGHSVLVYQHFPRQKRDAFVLATSKRIAEQTGACEVLVFQTSGVVFLLAPQHHATEYFATRMAAVVENWKGLISTSLIAVE